MADFQGKGMEIMSLEHLLAQRARKCSKSKEDMTKGQRSKFEGPDTLNKVRNQEEVGR